MKKRTLMTPALILLTSAGFAVAAGQNDADSSNRANGKRPAHARQHGEQRGNGLPRGFEQLGLSDAQKSKIQSIMQQNRPERSDNQEDRRAQHQQRMEQHRAQHQQLMTGKTFDEQAANRMINERQQERAAMEKEHAERELQMLKQQHAVFQVLTPAQQQKYLENQKQREQRMPQRGKR